LESENDNLCLKTHVKNFNNRNNVLEIVLIYCSKCLILIFFIKFLPLMEWH